MIILHRFNTAKEFVLNADLIKYVEETPDTVVTLTNNEKLLVQEKASDIIRRVLEYARAVRMPSDFLSDAKT